MDVRNLAGKTALVTGAASGIGQQSALAFGRRGADLVICDIDEAGLAETEKELQGLGRQVQSRRVDVADRDAMQAFANDIHQHVDSIDLLMNNAGVALGGRFLDTSLEDWDWILGINLRGVIHGCHFFVPKMKEAGRGGHVVNVSSAAGYLPASVLSAYGTTKYAVLGLSESLSIELAPHGIGVTALCPGIIDTPITRSARLRGELDSADMRTEMVSRYGKRGYGPERVATNLLKAIQKNRTVAPISPEAWLGYGFKRLAPGLVRWLAARGERNAMESIGS
ncbi:MAG: SDR family NAD(P)-dependent oxidoreductase [Deltaproteobacteria bacterium]|nr:SDR family NAD(P)-dependent oxidoreductase [Deltaproteobacteria bacterium]MBW2395979.1 SDR family NAD(P)-dependent oxidoreductase [Deltaproteobacteria bacterium]